MLHYCSNVEWRAKNFLSEGWTPIRFGVALFYQQRARCVLRHAKPSLALTRLREVSCLAGAFSSLCSAIYDGLMDDQTKDNDQNNGGRPNLAAADILAHRLVTRVNEQDYQGLMRDFKTWRTGRAGRIADYLREIIRLRNEHTPNLGTTESAQLVELTQTMHMIRQHLRHIDTNYNQVTKRINNIEHTGKLYHEVQTSKVLIEQIAPLITQIDTVLKAQTEAFFKK